MKTLHTFGCSITLGHALPDVVRPPPTDSEIQALGRPPHWSDEHILKPSMYAWPSVLAEKLGVAVHNHARRGACFQQIARQCVVATPEIEPNDIIIVMWTYLSRLSLQWPARTSVPLTHLVDPSRGWRTRILPGFNKWFGLTPSTNSNDDIDERIYTYIHNSAQYTFDPMGIYDRYYNNLVLLSISDGFLRHTGAKVIHLSVEPEPYPIQLASAAENLDPSLQTPYIIPHPDDWYVIPVDHHSCRVIHDPDIPTAGSDRHPSVQHHGNFAEHVYEQYFRNLS